jgi:hypothetical protein
VDWFGDGKSPSYEEDITNDSIFDNRKEFSNDAT